MMRRLINTSVLALAFGIVSGLCASATAEEIDLSALEVERDSTYYQTQTYRPNPRAIVHEKAQARAYQRQARMASMQWYGMSNSRPQAASTPFTSRYSPVWETAGGKPYSWRPTYDWPVYYVR
jgi:predicted GIY-YIG superfamily endonuclease